MRSVCDLEGGAVLGAGAAMVVDAGGGDVGVPEPLLHLGDVGRVVERVGRRGRAEPVHADLEPELSETVPLHLAHDPEQIV